MEGGERWRNRPLTQAGGVTAADTLTVSDAAKACEGRAASRTGRHQFALIRPVVLCWWAIGVLIIDLYEYSMQFLVSVSN